MRLSVRDLLTLVALAGVFLAIMGPRWQRTYSDRRHKAAVGRAFDAAAAGDLEAVTRAIADGLDPNITNSDGDRLLDYAARRNDVALARRLLELGADPTLVPPHAGDNRLLVSCVERGNAELIELFLAHGLDANAKVANVAPLRAAMQSRLSPERKLRVVRILLEHGARLEPAEVTMDNALPHAGLVDLFRQYGAPYTAREALVLNRLEELKRMVAEDPALLHKRWSGLVAAHPGCEPTLLGLALQRGNRDAVDFLMESGAPLDNREGLGGTLLHMAVPADDRELIERLIAHGLDVNTIDDFKDTALHDAVNQGRARAAAALIKAGADVNVKDFHGKTPLQRAIDRQHVVIVQLLLAAGVDIALPDDAGRTALDRARAANNPVLLKLVESAAQTTSSPGSR